MAFGLLIIGILLLVSAVRDSQGNLIALFKTDFTGSHNFVFWVVAILLIGAVGYVDKLKPLSDGLLVLVLLGLILSRGNPGFNSGGGFFKQFTSAIGTSESASASGVGGAIGGAITSLLG